MVDGMAGAPISPMLASPGPLPVGPGWAFEFKWDGVRALAVVTEGKTRLYARSGVEITIAYPDLAGAGGDLEDALLDGELVVMDEAGRPSFQMLAERMHVRDRARAARLAVTYPVTYLVFDVLRLGRVELFDVPYRERRALLDELALGDRCVVPPAFDDGPATVAASRENQLEGVVAKRLAATYRPGVRSPDWVKVKLDETEEFVVGGWRPGARALGALLVGLPDPGTGALRFVGRVGGGISAASERQLLDTLKPLETATSPFGDTVPRMDARQAVWCRPEVVVELKYGNRTRDGKLRFPRFIRLRPDLSPADLSSSGPRDSSSGPRDA
jgi:bifunctional non-homologous end joining protein LigD